jgi:glycine dehydrogenase
MALSMALPWKPTEHFVDRHLGPDAEDRAAMLRTLGLDSIEALIASTVPESIRLRRSLDLPGPLSEAALFEELAEIASHNQVFKSFIGMGYAGCITPPVILRNVLENPGWYTAYTPYQAEIAQGRLEALLNFQQMVIDLTGLEVANASLLDEATAAAEAMHMLYATRAEGHDAFFVAEGVFPQTLEVVRTRAAPLGIEVLSGDPWKFDFAKKKVFGVLVQAPAADGSVEDWTSLFGRVHAEGAHAVVAADLLSLALLTPPGEMGADVAVGSTQRFGVPMGFGGPHAAYFATRTQFTRHLPGRIIGVSQDATGKPALRMALQTREQHIRREKATSNICTAQVLLAVMASMYAVYHGPKGIRSIAERVHALTLMLARGLVRLGLKPKTEQVFDTLQVHLSAEAATAVHAAARARRMNLARVDAETVGISLDETTTPADVEALWQVFASGRGVDFSVSALGASVAESLPAPLLRKSSYLAHPVFNRYHSETEMLRYLKRLESRDLSLTHSMIALGSCTMKLNATTEMIPVTWPEFGALHPFCPADQAAGYHQLFRELERWLAEITGFSAVSLQPNAGSQGEYAGLLVIRAYHQARGQGHRDVCLIPSSAHGTNPASAVMAGYQVVVVRTDASGNIDVADLEARAEQHKDRLAALMVTYPSTHGVFEEDIQRICQAVHARGGQVYMDGANMNAQVGLCRPGDIGADVCHLNLHKTFCIPHGGGGPGMGPIGVAAHLAPFLPRHPLVSTGGSSGIGPVSAAPWGSASILIISYAYIRMMGAEGLRSATETAILNANYLAEKLEAHYPVLYRGKKRRVAHECILDLRGLKKSAGVEVEDVAKRLIDYGFHAPTVSFPVAGTMMVEPTESESLAELDRFCQAMVSIRREVAEVEAGRSPREGNVLKHAPHTAEVLVQEKWDRSYSRAAAAFPAPWLVGNKFWPVVSRLNNVLGDRQLVCTCPPVEDYV